MCMQKCETPVFVHADRTHGMYVLFDLFFACHGKSKTCKIYIAHCCTRTVKRDEKEHLDSV
jgi:hypothetical protein